jgi:membrane dipeptidase
VLLRSGLDRLWRELDLTRGLTSLGCAVVERMFELGMIVDVTHCTPAARRQVYQFADRAGVSSRVVATHVGAFEINPTPYNLEDWEIRWFADRGGIVGVIFMNYWLAPWQKGIGLDLIARTIEHMVQVAGGTTAHVALGSDFDGFTDPPDDLNTAAELPRLTQRLLASMWSIQGRKYSDQEIENILGKNALRVLHEGWGKVN